MIQCFENLVSRLQAPAAEETQKFLYPGVKQIFLDSIPFRGRPTKVFACYGLPENASAASPVPGVVLIHGGGATALANWVELWVKRGYAAISMDTCGCVPAWSPSFAWTLQGWMPHEAGGPRGWGRFEAAAEAPEEQWICHATAAAVAAHSFLRSLPGVDPKRIGVTGISWGGVLSCIAAAVDRRFAWMASVYGCGFLNTPDSCLRFEHPKSTDELRAKWCELWDPANYLGAIGVPTFFLAGTNDVAFPLDSLQKSLALPKDARSLLRVEYPHNHVISWEEKTLYRFADAMSRTEILPRPGKITARGGKLRAALSDAPPPVSVSLQWTRGSGWWNGRKWETAPAEYRGGFLRAPMPRCVSAAYFTASFADGSAFSTPVWQAPDDGGSRRF